MNALFGLLRSCAQGFFELKRIHKCSDFYDILVYHEFGRG